MKSIANQYRDLKEGRMSQANFMRNLRMMMPQYVTNVTSFNDAVRILKSKSILTETMEIQPVLEADEDFSNDTNYDALDAADTNAEELAKAAGSYDAAVGMLEDEMGLSFSAASTIAARVYPEGGDDNAKTQSMISKIEKEKAGEEAIMAQHDPLEEALNKDIKSFGQDLDKRFKEAGFNTLVIMQAATPEQLKIVATNPKAALFEVSQTPETQMLVLHVNPKMEAKAKSIVNKFQLSSYNGPVLRRGWTAKQVQGAINPGDIVKQEEGRGVFYFYRLAKVDTKIKNVTEGKGKDLHPNQINPDELRMGIKVELEHTDDLDEAKKIALDHLAENPYYYTALKLAGVESFSAPKVKAPIEKKAKRKKETVELVDKENQMKSVLKKKLKEARLNIDGEPNAVVKQAMAYVNLNPMLKIISDDIEFQQSNNPNEAILRYRYWKELPDEAIAKLKLQFDIEKNRDYDEDTGNLFSYFLTPKNKANSADLGASFEKFKSQLKEMIRKAVNEMQSDK